MIVLSLRVRAGHGHLNARIGCRPTDVGRALAPWPATTPSQGTTVVAPRPVGPDWRPDRVRK